MLDINDAVKELAAAIATTAALPKQANEDALHIALYARGTDGRLRR